MLLTEAKVYQLNHKNLNLTKNKIIKLKIIIKLHMNNIIYYILYYKMCSINHDKKAIFIHIPKTGGTFIRENLEKYYGFKFYILKRADHDKFCKVNEFNKNNNFKQFVSNRVHGVLKYAKTSNYINRMINMNKEKWDSYKIFCFVRNPYDRLISGWNFLKSKHDINIPFDQYIFQEDSVSDFEYIHSFMSQYKNMIDENDNFKVDYLGKFENLEEDFKNILLKIGFDENEINHDKEKKNNFSHFPYKDIIDNQVLLDRVNEVCNEDFENFFYNKVEKIEDLKNNINLESLHNLHTLEFKKYLNLGGTKIYYKLLDYDFYDTIILYPELVIFKNNIEAIKDELYKNIENMNDWLLKDKNNKFYSKHTIIPIYGYNKWSKYANDFSIIKNLIESVRNIETVCFLKLSANARLDKHYGYNPSSNYILRSHLGLIIPNNCGMWVNGTIKFHKNSEFFTFDDSKLHTAFNNSKDDRFILLIDMKRPDFIKIGNSQRVDNNDELIKEFILENTAEISSDVGSDDKGFIKS
jgi:hypothetical protein